MLPFEMFVLFLDVLPSGDPSQYALPVFLKEPSDTFVVKSRAATLHCRVAHAIDIHFQVIQTYMDGSLFGLCLS